MKILLAKINDFIHTEAVLTISAAAALLSMFFVPPSAAYFDYIDLRVLGLLFCLMAVVGGFQRTGVFYMISESLLRKVNSVRALGFVLIMICFFSSMWITNDVALITFVPFAIMTLSMVGQKKHIIRIVVLQTIAANLGSMLMPIGNPQNLYLYSNFHLRMGNFLKITLPCTVVSFILLCIAVLFLRKDPIGPNTAKYKEILPKRTRQITLYSILFLLCIVTVLQLLDYRITFLIVVFTILLADIQVLRRVDYSLLLTFVCFFLFVGNIGNISTIKEYLASLLNDRVLPASIAISQVISNVPCAVLLSAFTDDYKALILGTNIGGLGTLVASLASLISYKFYCKTENARPGKYLLVFTIYNLLFLAVLCLVFIS